MVHTQKLHNWTGVFVERIIGNTYLDLIYAVNSIRGSALLRIIYTAVSG